MVEILDGGIGQELIRRSCAQEPESWANAIMVQYPAILEQIHRDYIDAGATIITTNTYAAHADRLEGTDMAVCDLIDLACNIAMRAADGRAVTIAGSIGPLVQSYRPDLHPEYEEAVGKYETNVKQLLHHGCTIILIETVSSALQARAALDAVRRSSAEARCWLSLTVDDHNPSVLRSGEASELILPLAKASNVEVLLVNCTAPEAMTEALQTLQRAASTSENYSSLRWGCYANGFTRLTSDFLREEVGQEKGSEGHTHDNTSGRDLSPARFADYGVQWVKDCQCSVIGGCCGTTPAHIKAMAQAQALLARGPRKEEGA